jgi:chaperonin GroEL (HSP60 family)
LFKNLIFLHNLKLKGQLTRKPAVIQNILNLITIFHFVSAVCDAIRTSLGPRGMDKMIQAANGEVTITNDGATILKQMNVIHPAAKMLVELSKAQDIEAGDGTTSVVVIAGALLEASEKLLGMGIHPTGISDAFQRCAKKAVQILTEMSSPVLLSDHDSLVKSAATSLSSKVVSQQGSLLASIAVDAVLKATEPGREFSVDLKNVKVIRSLGGTIEDTELIDGLVFTQRASGTNGPKRLEKVKIGLIQFCISPPKTDVSTVVILVSVGFYLVFLLFSDGPQRHCQRLCRHGPCPERRTCLHPKHCKTNQKERLQRPSRPKIHLT